VERGEAFFFISYLLKIIGFYLFLSFDLVVIPSYCLVFLFTLCKKNINIIMIKIRNADTHNKDNSNNKDNNNKAINNNEDKNNNNKTTL